jgi:hypothetical protein
VSPNPWGVLGIEPTQDVITIRRAYATVLKRTRPDEDPAGFAELRQAYEQALMQARMGAVAVQRAPAPAATAEVVAPAVTPVVAPAGQSAAAAVSSTADLASGHQPPPQAPTELEQLRLALLALKQAAVAAAPADPQTLRALLEACLEAPALETLSVQLEFEPVMVHFLIQTQPVTQCLLETVIQRWKWRERLRTRVGPGITALLAHADNLRTLEQLEKTSPSAYRALTRPPRPLLLWMAIVFFSLHRSVREALGQFRGVSPNIFNPRALQWWNWFLTEPHPRPVLIHLTGALMLCGFLAGSDWAHHGDYTLRGALAGVGFGALAGCALTGLWWVLVDWPRYRLRAIRLGAVRGLRLGWAPACLAACILSAFLPDTLVATLAALVVGLALLFWAVAMAPAFADFNTSPLHRVWALTVVNLPLALWWLIFLDYPSMLPTTAMSVVFVATLLSFALGQPLLAAEFLHDLRFKSRQAARWGILALALGGLALAALATPGAPGSRLILMGLVAIVLMHRTPAGNLSAKQLKARYYVCLVAAISIVPAFIREGSTPVLQFGGSVFMLGVMVSTVMGFYNDRRATRLEALRVA